MRTVQCALLILLSLAIHQASHKQEGCSIQTAKVEGRPSHQEGDGELLPSLQPNGFGLPLSFSFSMMASPPLAATRDLKKPLGTGPFLFRRGAKWLQSGVKVARSAMPEPCGWCSGGLHCPVSGLYSSALFGRKGKSAATALSAKYCRHGSSLPNLKQ